MIVITGATGQLGRLVIANLLKRVPANQIVAAARTPSNAADLAALGVKVREADYGKPTPGHASKIYELGGDTAFTMAQFATEVSKQVSKTIVYNNLPEKAYQDILVSVGLPAKLAHLIADSDTKAASHGELYTSSRDLSGLIGHPTTTLAAAVAAALPQ